ncbi:MAG: 50S ribosomal protein L22 [Candidatus Diapherotrites archaeon]|uniref:Large ribosomal subunit protein uL22 n=1 Tax=Candidatus Iainarchaeum sp. TaxID=3101447 RepID=A0A939C8F8_9ARCH|nr:50S ribosomal protein L22 [Candidatus Diapherotrites archaeon]
MVKKNYQKQFRNEKKLAKAIAKNQAISLKYATEMCRELQGMNLEKAVAMVQRIAEKKEFLPLRKYRKKVAHRKGQAKSGVKSGRFPESTCRVFLKLLESVKSNADFKGLDPENLVIVHCFASKGFRRRGIQPKGRIGGKVRKRKSCHVEIAVIEAK